MIPERLLNLVRNTECDKSQASHYPCTLFYNEGWMLRLLLDAFQSEGIEDHPLSFLENARWYSEARLPSPFSAQRRGDGRGEGSTSADNTIGHFQFREGTVAGLKLNEDATQFVVVEAKMGSKLSEGTTNAKKYNQAARNVACMAEVIHRWAFPNNDSERAQHSLNDLSSVGFYVIAPADTAKIHERQTDANTICQAVEARRVQYDEKSTTLREWHTKSFTPLIDKLADGNLKVLSWESCIKVIKNKNADVGKELETFYQTCLDLTKRSEKMD